MELVQALCIRPRQLTKQVLPRIAEGAEANLTLFNPNTVWTFEHKHIQSKSKNTPFVGTQFKGKVVGTIRKRNLSLNLV